MTRKANSHMKRLQRSARYTLRNTCAAFVVDGQTQNSQVFNYKTGKRGGIPPQAADFITGMPWKWYVECSVICRDQNGREYIVSEPVYFNSAYRYSDPRLSEFLNNTHIALYKKQNQLHVITLAWVAVPNLGEKVELPIETLDKIYTELGAFEYLSQWENNQLEYAA